MTHSVHHPLQHHPHHIRCNPGGPTPPKDRAASNTRLRHRHITPSRKSHSAQQASAAGPAPAHPYTPGSCFPRFLPHPTPHHSLLHRRLVRLIPVPVHILIRALVLRVSASRPLLLLPIR